jgi:cyclophilin family peptidyl-prolyl cis-trans isomerase
MLPTSSELRRRSTTQRNSSSSSGIIISSNCNNKDILVTDPTSSQSPWSSLPQQQQQQQHDGAPRVHRPSFNAASISSSLSVNSLVSALRRPRVQALLCLCVTVLPWIYHSSQNHTLRSVHTALARLLREHRQLVAHLEHSQKELERAERDAREIELDNKELADLLAAAHAMQQQQQADEGSSIDVDSIGYLHHDEEEDAADSSSNRMMMYREAQHMEDLYLERIGIIEAAIKNHSLHRLREAYLPLTQQSNDNNKEDDNAKLYVEIRLVAEEEAVDDGPTPASSSAEEVLVVETAPISVAPHAIDHFLRLVEANYYGGRNFAMLHQPTLLPAAASVMLGAAAKSGAGEASKSVATRTHRIHTVERQQQQQQHDAAAITDAKKKTASNPEEELNGSRLLTSMAFREHRRHGAFPVQKYSVLFHGKPGGGPHFSIHMMDPSPRRQQQQPQQGGDEAEKEEEEEEEDWDHDDDDACFGRIVRGQDVLDRLVEASRSTKRQQRVIIDSVKLLPAGTW